MWNNLKDTPIYAIDACYVWWGSRSRLPCENSRSQRIKNPDRPMSPPPTTSPKLILLGQGYGELKSPVVCYSITDSTVGTQDYG